MKKQYVSPASHFYLIDLQEVMENYHTSHGTSPDISAVIRNDEPEQPDDDRVSFKNGTLWDK